MKNAVSIKTIGDAIIIENAVIISDDPHAAELEKMFEPNETFGGIYDGFLQ
jgi:hypothetical protein